MKIDAVITWVDGNDPLHKEKRLRYGDGNIFESDDVAGNTRFSSLGEIFYCVASLNRFAPWLHKIYIVTDGQDPLLLPFLEKYFPDGYIPIEIVDHKVIFRGYEEYLPVFNSIAIETMTWRIPELSEHYIELNDDFILSSPVVPEDFFLPNGKLLCYARRYNMQWTKFTRMLKPCKNGRKRVTFKGNMYNAALLAGRRFTFLKLLHTPRALRKSVYENYFSEHLDLMRRNISHRFRHAEQFTSQELQYLLLIKESLLEVSKDVDKLHFILQPKLKKGYVEKKIHSLSLMTNCKFCCFNSLDKASDKDRKLIIDWIEKRLGVF